jgi:DNA-binding winged helix-turn-helix (wHTH) protein
LLDGQEERPLEHRAARTLEVLCRCRGVLLSRDTLLAEVWNGRAVSSNSVAIVIADLRRALEDDPRNPAHIVTVPKRGYRLNDVAKDEPPPEIDKAEPRPRPTVKWLAMGGVLVTVIAFALLRPVFQSPTLLVEPVLNESGRADLDPLAHALGQLVVSREASAHNVRAMVPSENMPALPTRSLRLASRLIIWNHITTLALSVTNLSGRVIWAAMVVAPPDRLAVATLRKLDTLGAVSLGAGAG